MADLPQSSSSFNDSWTYDVFLSFRGEDTRYGFTGHLYKALSVKGIKTFIDDEKLQRGEEITPALLKAIQESRIAIVVFSKNYASSIFCLEELVKILEGLNQKGRLVLPVFYDIDPSDLRHLRNSYGDAMAKHEKRFQHNQEKVQKWKSALRDASNLSGWPFKPGCEYEHEFIEKITVEVSDRISRSPLHIAAYPVGLELQVKKVTSLLDVGSNERIMVGIYGMAGIGKTAIARAVYNLIADQFEGICYIDDISSKAFKHGLVHLQEIMLYELLREKDIKLYDIYKGIPILKSRLCQKKILIIFDNVDKLQQLQAIAGEPNWFGLGSKIIITTKDKHLLEAHSVGRTYEAELLSEKKALELFSWNAFKKKEIDLKYKDISYRAIQYCNRLPLALEIIGSTLSNKKSDAWESALNMYKEIPNKRIQEILMISYNELEEKEKEIFLDIACFFKGYPLEDIKNILQYVRGFYVEYVIEGLMSKSLVKLEWNCVTMHDLIEDMGKEIVRQQSPKKPENRNRLWFYEDILNILKDNKGTDEIEAIMLHLPKDKIVQWNGEAFKKMKNLKMLFIGEAQFSMEPKILPKCLRVLCWKNYPSSSLPSDFHSDKLFILNLSGNRFLLDKPLKEFKSLTVMNLSHCSFLEKVPDLSGIPNLTTVDLDFCENLVEVHDSIGSLGKLRLLTACGCTKLSIFPHDIKSAFLEDLDLSNCSSLQYFPKPSGVIRNVRKFILDSDATRLTRGCSVGKLLLPKLEILLEMCEFLRKCNEEHQEKMCKSSVSLDVPGLACRRFCWIDESSSAFIALLPILKELNLNFSGLKDEYLCKMIPLFSNLERLYLCSTHIRILPECIKECHFLTDLHLFGCYYLEEIRGVPPNIQFLNAGSCSSLSAQSISLLMSQTVHESGGTQFRLPKAWIPMWFDERRSGLSLSFWFRNKFPNIALCVVHGSGFYPSDLCVSINGIQYKGFLHLDKLIELYHTWLFDLQKIFYFNHKRMVFTKDKWNHVEVSIKPCKGRSKEDSWSAIGFYIYRQGIRADVRWESGPTPPKGHLMSSVQEPGKTFEFHSGLCYSSPLLRRWSILLEMEVLEAPHIQKQLLRAACDSLNTHNSFSLSHSSQNPIWSMQVPAKVKMLMRKICRNDLPTFENLYRKKLTNSSFCPICETERETIEHALLSCPWTQPIWFGSGFQCSSTNGNLVERFESWLYDQFEQIRRVHPHFDRVWALVGNICWAIWKGRNKFILEGHPVNPWETLIRAKTMHMEYSGIPFEEVCPTSDDAWPQSYGLLESRHFTSTNQQKSKRSRSENEAKESMNGLLESQHFTSTNEQKTKRSRSENKAK